MGSELTDSLYKITIRPDVHLLCRTARRATVEELAVAVQNATKELERASPVQGLVYDARDAPPTRDRDDFDARVVPLIAALMSRYKRSSVLVKTQAGLLHTRRTAPEAVKAFLNDMEAAIAYANGSK